MKLGNKMKLVKSAHRSTKFSSKLDKTLRNQNEIYIATKITKQYFQDCINYLIQILLDVAYMKTFNKMFKFNQFCYILKYIVNYNQKT